MNEDSGEAVRDLGPLPHPRATLERRSSSVAPGVHRRGVRSRQNGASTVGTGLACSEAKEADDALRRRDDEGRGDRTCR